MCWVVLHAVTTVIDPAWAYQQFQLKLIEFQLQSCPYNVSQKQPQQTSNNYSETSRNNEQADEAKYTTVACCSNNTSRKTGSIPYTQQTPTSLEHCIYLLTNLLYDLQCRYPLSFFGKHHDERCLAL